MGNITRVFERNNMDQGNGEWVALNSDKLGSKLLEVGSYIVQGQECIALRTFIQKRVLQYVGLDVREGPGVDIVSDAIAMPFHDNEFDSVVSLDMLEHCKYPHKVFHECFRVTKPGGYLLLATVFSFPIHEYGPGDFFRFTPKCLEFLALDAGYDVIEFTHAAELSNPGIVRVIGRKPV